MKWDALEEEPCSLARTVAVIGDRWRPVDLRECFLRKRRFEAFDPRSAITRHLLAERLKKLVRLGVLSSDPLPGISQSGTSISSLRKVSTFTPFIMSIVHWGDIHMVDARGRPLLHEHKNCGKTFEPGDGLLWSVGEPLRAQEVHVHAGPGAGPGLAAPAAESRSNKSKSRGRAAWTPAGEARLQQQRIKRTFGADSVPQNDAVIPSFALSRLSRRPAPQRTRCRPASTTSRSCHPEKRK